MEKHVREKVIGRIHWAYQVRTGIISNPTKEQKIEAETIEEVINTLSPNEQTAIRLHYQQGLSLKETGNRIKKRARTITEYCKNGIKKLSVV